MKGLRPKHKTGPVRLISLGLDLEDAQYVGHSTDYEP